MGFTGVVKSARRGPQPRGTDVHRESVIRDGRTVLQHDALIHRVDTHGLVVYEAMAGERAQWSQIHVTLVPRVMSRDVTREHPAVRRVDLLRDERDAHAGDLIHAEHLEHVHVAVTAANEDQVLHHRSNVAVHLPHGSRRNGWASAGSDEAGSGGLTSAVTRGRDATKSRA